MKKSVLRVLGPYKEPHGYRLVVIEADQRKALKFPTREQAEHNRGELEREIAKRSGRSIGQALAEYEQAMVEERGRKRETARETCARLARFLPLEESLGALSPAQAEALYRQESLRTRRDGQPLSAATHHLILKMAKSFAAWCMGKGYLGSNSFAHVKKVGRAKTGKPQLTANEGRRFLMTALKMAETGDAGALAAALQLALGLRSAEVLERCVRDVDEDGGVLLIGHGKTDNARRRPHIPEFLRPHLLRLTQGRPPAAFLFGSDRPRDTNYLLRKVREVCVRANLPIVCAHSLRGLHATLALRQGVSSHAVAEALGHGSFAVTARHYADPSALMDARTRTALEALREPLPPPAMVAAELPALAERLRQSLSPTDLEALIALLRLKG